MSKDVKGDFQMLKKMVMGSTAALLSLGALQVSAAEAHGWKKWHHHRPFVVIYGGDFGGYGGCGEYYWRWKKTGSFFWKKQYFMCRGIW